MGVRRLIFVLVVLVAPAAAHAEDHKWGTFVALSHTNTSGSKSVATSIWNGGLSTRQTDLPDSSGLGWHVAGEVTLTIPWLKENVAFVGDASGHLIGEDGKRDATQITVMVGPRLAIPLPGESPESPLHFFVHLMAFGAIHRSDSRLDINTSSAAYALGGGVDLMPFNHDGFRVQVDWIIPWAPNVERSRRISFGYVHRFH